MGLAVARLRHQRSPEKTSLTSSMIVMSALALLPDADVIAFKLRIPYHAPFGHRGASHSLMAALVCAILCTLIYQMWTGRRGRLLLCTGLSLFAVLVSHGLLDTLTDGGLGCALLWPFSNQRFFAPWQPIPVAPIGARLLSARGRHVILTELVYFLPLLAYALWPRKR